MPLLCPKEIECSNRAPTLVRHACGGESEFNSADRPDKREFVAFAKMADAECLARQLRQTRAERDVVFLEGDLAKNVRVMAIRHQNGGKHGRVLGRILTDGLQPPTVNR